MVTSGTVNGHLSSFQECLNNYQSEIGNTSGGWKGLSHDNLVNKGETFASEYGGTIKKQMAAFASAIDAYANFVVAKDNLKNAKSNEQEAIRCNDTSKANMYHKHVETFSSQVDSLRSSIKSYLEEASSPKLSASTISYAASSEIPNGLAESINSAVRSAVSGDANKAALAWAVDIANDDSHGYSQPRRSFVGGTDFDCSSLVIAAYEAAGVPVRSKYGANTTYNMKKSFLASGQFEWIPMSEVRYIYPGDIFLDEDSHTEMYYGKGSNGEYLNVGAHSDYSGSEGDPSGREINIKTSGHHWDGVLHYVGNKNVNSESTGG